MFPLGLISIDIGFSCEVDEVQNSTNETPASFVFCIRLRYFAFRNPDASLVVFRRGECLAIVHIDGVRSSVNGIQERSQDH